ncbi:MAG: guanylate kinase [Anaerolineae bacterium]|nr:guanylate kinase [Anaerolineae bacterium]
MESPWIGENHKHEPLLIVISGPSGVGKDSVVQSLKQRNQFLHFVITATSRAPRPEEVDGVDYFFVSNEEFQQMIKDDELLEHAVVYGEFKGIPKAQVRDALASGQDVIMRLDVQGASTIRALAPEAVLVFLTTTSEEELVQRLKARKTESPEKLKLRIETARQEYTRIEEFDYVVYNREGQLQQAVDVILAIIQAEHHQVKQRKVEL